MKRTPDNVIEDKLYNQVAYVKCSYEEIMNKFYGHLVRLTMKRKFSR